MARAVLFLISFLALPAFSQDKVERYQVEAELTGLKHPQDGDSTIVFAIPPNAMKRDGKVQNGDTVIGRLVVDDEMRSSVAVYGHWIGENGKILKTAPSFRYTKDLEEWASGFGVLAEGRFRFPQNYRRDLKGNLCEAINEETAWPAIVTFMEEISEDEQMKEGFFTERLAKDIMVILEEAKPTFYELGSRGVTSLFEISETVSSVYVDSHGVQDPYFRLIESIALDNLPHIKVNELPVTKVTTETFFSP